MGFVDLMCSYQCPRSTQAGIVEGIHSEGLSWGAALTISKTNSQSAKFVYTSHPMLLETQ